MTRAASFLAPLARHGLLPPRCVAAGLPLGVDITPLTEDVVSFANAAPLTLTQAAIASDRAVLRS